MNNCYILWFIRYRVYSSQVEQKYDYFILFVMMILERSLAIIDEESLDEINERLGGKVIEKEKGK